MDAVVDDVAATPKQQYDGAFVDPEDAFPEDPPAPEPGAEPEAEGEAGVSRATRLKTAKFLILQCDKLQATIFTMFGAKGHADEFRWTAEDRREMADALADGIPENWNIDWWMKLALLMTIATGANVVRLQEIKEQKRLAEAAEAARKAEEEAQAMEPPVEALQAKREQRREARAAAQAPPDGPITTDMAAPPAVTACEECGGPAPAGKRFCGSACAGRYGVRKREANKAKKSANAKKG